MNFYKIKLGGKILFEIALFLLHNVKGGDVL